MMTLFYVYELFKSYCTSKHSINLISWISSKRCNIICTLIILFVSMMLFRPLLTYYSAIANWLGDLAIIGLALQIYWHSKKEELFYKDHLKRWKVWPNNIFISRKEFMFVIENELGEDASNVSIFGILYIYPLSLKNGTTNNLKDVKYKKLPCKFGAMVLRNKDSGTFKPVISYHTFYVSLKNGGIKKTGSYLCKMKFIQHKNKDEHELLFIYYFNYDNECNSNVEQFAGTVSRK